MAGLYIHIPFCKSRCSYCGFYSTTLSELRQQYVDALCKEIPVLKAYRTDADITVDALGRGQYFSLEEALAAAQASSRQETVIQILGGEWERPRLPKKSRVKLVLRQGAVWK